VPLVKNTKKNKDSLDLEISICYYWVIMRRTLNESSTIIARTIAEIRSHGSEITEELIERTCINYEIDEDVVRKIAGFKKKVT
jgi:hypothetical protein